MVGIMPAPSLYNKTPAERLMTEMGAEERPSGTMTKAQREHFDLLHQIRRDFMVGNTTEAEARMQGAVQQGVINRREIGDLRKMSTQTPASYAFKRLNADDALRVWEVMDDEERRVALKEMTMKMISLIKNASPQKRNELLPKFKAALGR